MAEVRRAWVAYAISQAGSGIGVGALPLVAILVLGVSDWQVSVLAAVAGIAGAAVFVPLGSWVEFHRKRPAMIAADVLRCASLASVPVARWLGALTYAQLRVIAAVQTVGVILSSAATAAYLKGVVAAALGARTALIVLAGVLLASVVLLPWKAWRPGPGSERSAVPDLQTDGAQR